MINEHYKLLYSIIRPAYNRRENLELLQYVDK